MAKESIIIGITSIIVLIIVGIMLVNIAVEQDIADEAKEATINIGNLLILVGGIGIALLVIMGLIILSKKIGVI